MKNAFSVFVFGSYERFLPYYVYSIEKAYPSVDIIIFYNSTLSTKVRKYLNSKSFVKVHENFFEEYDFFKNYKILGGGGMTLLRCLIPKEYFSNYEFVYFGDVDVLILKDYHNLFDYHKQQAIKANLPFSNKVRLLPNGNLSRRLTGLHFIITEPYYNKVNPIIVKILENDSFRINIIEKVNRDEEFLYVLNEEAFNFDPLKISENKTPLHGFHLGVFRKNNKIHPNEIRDNSLLTYDEIKLQLRDLLRDNEFLFIMNNFYSPEMIRTLMYFELKIPFLLKVKYFFEKQYSFSILKKVVNKVKKYITFQRSNE